MFSQLNCPPRLYPCLRFTVSLAVTAQDSGPSGSLLLSWKALSSSTSCRLSGKAMARTGLRMKPTFPSPPRDRNHVTTVPSGPTWPLERCWTNPQPRPVVSEIDSITMPLCHRFRARMNAPHTRFNIRKPAQIGKTESAQTYGSPVTECNPNSRSCGITNHLKPQPHK